MFAWGKNTPGDTVIRYKSDLKATIELKARRENVLSEPLDGYSFLKELFR